MERESERWRRPCWKRRKTGATNECQRTQYIATNKLLPFPQCTTKSIPPHHPKKIKLSVMRKTFSSTNKRTLAAGGPIVEAVNAATLRTLRHSQSSTCTKCRPIITAVITEWCMYRKIKYEQYSYVKLVMLGLLNVPAAEICAGNAVVLNIE